MKSMSSLIQLLLLPLLCFPLHACTARPLTATQKETQKYRFHKVIDQIKLLETLGESKLKKAKQQKVANGSVSNLKQLIFVTTSGVFPSLDIFLNFFPRTEVSGATSVQTDLPFFKKKELKRHARSLLGVAHGHVEQTVNSNTGDVDDIVEMDYAQPHRKPPIHNAMP